MDGTGDAASELWVRLLGALERPCPVCGGGGRMRSHEWRAWRARTDELVRVVEAARRAATMPGGDGPRPLPPGVEPVNGHNGGPPQNDPYDTDPYRSAPYAPDHYQQDPYDPYQPDPYQQDAYQQDPYPADPYPDVPFPSGQFDTDLYAPDPYQANGDGYANGDDYYDGDIDPGEGMLRAIVARAGRQPVPRLPQEPPRTAEPARMPENRPARPATGPQPTVPIAASVPPPAQQTGPPAAIVSALDRAINEHIRARPTGPELVPCEECHGSGTALTEAGAGLTRFLARHGLVWADPGLNGAGGPPVQRRDGPLPPPARGQQ